MNRFFVERIVPDAVDKFFPAADDPRLRAADKFVAAEADKICAGRDQEIWYEAGAVSAYDGDDEIFYLVAPLGISGRCPVGDE